MIAPQPTDHDVVVIGLGPTGATLANLLGLCGLSVLVMERAAEIYPLPRAVHFDDEAMRVFQTIGIADAVFEKTTVNKGTRFVDPDGTILLDWPRPQELSVHGWHPSYRFHQPELEEELRRALQDYASIDVKLGHAAERIMDHGDHVTVSYRDRETDARHHATTKYVVGCDGTRSLVREVMGTAMHQLGFEQRWLVVDLLLKREKPELGKFTLQFCDPVRPATYCCNPGNRRRWEFALLEGEDDQEMSRPDTVWRLLSRWLSEAEADLERQAIYSFQSAVAKAWRQGRLLLAGDAAHLTPPFMGQGMCAGIRDAANLAWKLALCCKGHAGETLLDTYQSERHSNAASYVETAVNMGKLVNRMGAEYASKLGDSSGNGAALMQSLQLKLGPGLGNVADETRGGLFPQPRLSSGQLMDDLIGYQPVLIVDGEMVDRQIPADLQVVATGDEPALKPILSDMGATAVLIRPDRYVLGSARTRGALDRLIDDAWSSFR